MTAAVINPDIEFAKHPNCYFANHPKSAGPDQKFVDPTAEEVLELIQSPDEVRDVTPAKDSF